MKGNARLTFALAVVAGFLSLAEAPSAAAQQVTGTPGSPSATTTIDGKQIPPPPPKFGGVIKESAKDSTPWWPPRVVPPKGAPNVLLIMTDDQGYGVPGTFGGVIPTPALDRIAKNGLRYTEFHSTALCSPTRAALITGRNHHSVGFKLWRDPWTGLPYDNIPCGGPHAIRPTGANPAWGVIPQLAFADISAFAEDAARTRATVDWAFADRAPDDTLPGLLWALRIRLDLDEGGKVDPGIGLVVSGGARRSTSAAIPKCSPRLANISRTPRRRGRGRHAARIRGP